METVDEMDIADQRQPGGPENRGAVIDDIPA
jgi:hypothetical protein